MKVDRSKAKRKGPDPPPDVKLLIKELLDAYEKSPKALSDKLATIKAWAYSKSDFFYWHDVVDKFDDLLEEACKPVPPYKYVYACDRDSDEELRTLVKHILRFLAMVIENTYSRSSFSSIDHLMILLCCNDLEVSYNVLILLYTFARRSNYFTRLNENEKQDLWRRLQYLAESWGGPNSEFKLATVCDVTKELPASATSVRFEYFQEDESDKKYKSNVVHINDVRAFKNLPSGAILHEVLSKHNIKDPSQQIQLLLQIRMVKSFGSYHTRLLSVQLRLQALTVLLYNQVISGMQKSFLYTGFIQELVNVLKLESSKLAEVKTTVLRALTAVVHFGSDTNRVRDVIEATGSNSYHGIVPILVRNSVESLIETKGEEAYPSQLITSIFSYLYHVSYFEQGIEALVASGMIETMLKIISWCNGDDESLGFTTRAVRVVDLLATADVQGFQSLGGLKILARRLLHESEMSNLALTGKMEYDVEEVRKEFLGGEVSNKNGVTIYPQRAALIKSIFSFLKKSVPQHGNGDNLRLLFDEGLLKAMKHIICNSNYYGATLFLMALDVITSFIVHEPSLLSLLQESGLTKAMLDSILLKDPPSTREVLVSLPSICSALCLNKRGLDEFLQYKPFDKFFKILVSEEYLPAMRRRRTTEYSGRSDTAVSLGNDIDELMRHQPSIKIHAMQALVRLLKSLAETGSQGPIAKARSTEVAIEKNSSVASSNGTTSVGVSPVNEHILLLNVSGVQSPSDQGIIAMDTTEDSFQSMEENLNMEYSNSDSEGDYTTSSSAFPASVGPVGSNPPESQTNAPPVRPPRSSRNFQGHWKDCNMVDCYCRSWNNFVSMIESGSGKESSPPVVEYISNVCKFIEAILTCSNVEESTDFFVEVEGVGPLLDLLTLPCLPLDFASSSYCSSLASLIRAIHQGAPTSGIVGQIIKRINTLLIENEKCMRHDGSVASCLMRDMRQSYEKLSSEDAPAQTSNESQSQLTKISAFKRIADIHTHLSVLNSIWKTPNMSHSADSKLTCAQTFGNPTGSIMINKLGTLYSDLIWESTILLALCTDGTEYNINGNQAFIKNVLVELEPKNKTKGGSGDPQTSFPVTSETPMDVDEQSMFSPNDAFYLTACKICKPLVQICTKLAKSVNETFQMIVRVPQPQRGGRRMNMGLTHTQTITLSDAINADVARVTRTLLYPSLPSRVPNDRFMLTYLVCMLNFLSKVLFTENNFLLHATFLRYKDTGVIDVFFRIFKYASEIAKENEHDKHVNKMYTEFITSWLSICQLLTNPVSVVDTSVVGVVSPVTKNFDPKEVLDEVHRWMLPQMELLLSSKFFNTFSTPIPEIIITIANNLVDGASMLKPWRAHRDLNCGNARNAVQDTDSARNLPDNVTDQAVRYISEEMGFQRTVAILALQASAGSLEGAVQMLVNAGPRSVRQFEEAMTNPTLNNGEGNSTERVVDGGGKKNVPLDTFSVSPVSQYSTRRLDIIHHQDYERLLQASIMPFLSLADMHYDSVYKVVEFLDGSKKMSDTDWFKVEVVGIIISSVASAGNALLDQLSKQVLGEDIDSKVASVCHDSASAKSLSSRLHVLNLLAEKYPDIVMSELNKGSEAPNISYMLTSLVAECRRMFGVTAIASQVSPRWLTLAYISLDKIMRHNVITKRKNAYDKQYENEWKVFDARVMKWSPFSTRDTEILNTAYEAGKRSVDLRTGPTSPGMFPSNSASSTRTITCNFDDLAQSNEASAHRKPVIREVKGFSKQVLKRHEEFRKTLKPVLSKCPGSIVAKARKMGTGKGNSWRVPSKTLASAAAQRGMEELILREEKKAKAVMENDESNPEEEFSFHVGSADNLGFTTAELIEIMENTVALISCKMSPDTLHAQMRLLLRITRDSEMAVKFAKQGGIRVLLSLDKRSHFDGFQALFTHILRHVIEQECVLELAMQSFVYCISQGLISNVCGVNSKEVRDFEYVIRTGWAGAGRSPVLFEKFAKSMLKLEYVYGEAKRYINPVSPPKDMDFLVAGDSPKVDAYNKLLYEVMTDIFDHIIDAYENRQKQGKKANEGPKAQPTSSSSMNENGETVDGIESFEVQQETWKNDKSAGEPILHWEDYIRVLAELTKHYPHLASVITELYFESDLIPNDSKTTVEATEGRFQRKAMTALSFVIENMSLKSSKAQDEKKNALNMDDDCVFATKLLFASIAFAVDNPTAQLRAIDAIRGSLYEILLLQESCEKHERLQAIANLIFTMIEACPKRSLPNAEHDKDCSSRPSVNQIARLMVKRQMVNELARVPFSLNMRTPEFEKTMNSVLKPLEMLSTQIPLMEKKKNDLRKEKKVESSNQNIGETAEPSSMTEMPQQQNEDIVMDNEFQDIIHDEEDSDDVVTGEILIAEDDSLNADDMEITGREEEDEVDITFDMDDDGNDDDEDEDAQQGEQMERDSTSNDEEQSTCAGEDVRGMSRHRAMELFNLSSEFFGEVVGMDDMFLRSDPTNPLDLNNRIEIIEAYTRRPPDAVVMRPLRGEQSYNTPTHPLLTRSREAAVNRRSPQMGGNSTGIGISFDPRTSLRTVFGSSGYDMLNRPHLVRRQTRHHIGFGPPIPVRNFASPPSAPRTENVQEATGNTIRQGCTPALLTRLLGPALMSPPPPTSNASDINSLPISHSMGVRGPWSVQRSAPAQPTRDVQFPPEFLGTFDFICVLSTLFQRWCEECYVLDGPDYLSAYNFVRPSIALHIITHNSVVTVDPKFTKSALKEKYGSSFIESEDNDSDQSNVAEGIVFPEDDPDGVDDGDSEDREEESTSDAQPASRLAYERVRVPFSVSTPTTEDNTTPTPSGGIMNWFAVESSNRPTLNQPEPMETTNGSPRENVSAHETVVVSQQSSRGGTSGVDSDTTDLEIPVNVSISATDSGALSVSIFSEPLGPGSNNRVEIPMDTSDGSLTQNNNESSSSVAENAAVSAPLVPTTSAQQPTVSTAAETSTSTGGGSSSIVDEIPEEIDESFLAALPPDLRAEVIADHNRAIRLRREREQQQQQQPPANTGENSSSSAVTAAASDVNSGTAGNDINMEVVNQLPSNIREEVLADYRAIQAASRAPDADPSGDPVDFFQTLAPSLRRQVLADLDDSLLSVLPSELLNEARTLRRDQDPRPRLTVRPEIIESSTPGVFEGFSGFRPLPITRANRTSYGGPVWSRNRARVVPEFMRGAVYGGETVTPFYCTSIDNTRLEEQKKSKPLVDIEGLTCLIILLFTSEREGIELSRVCRILRNVSIHIPTRQWIVETLMKFLAKSCSSYYVSTQDFDRGSYKNPEWLTLSVHCGMVRKVNVFNIKLNDEKSSDNIVIHPKVTADAMHNLLKVVRFLTMGYPSYFLPYLPRVTVKTIECVTEMDRSASSFRTRGSNIWNSAGWSSPQVLTSLSFVEDIWSVLSRLDDSFNANRKELTNRSSILINGNPVVINVKSESNTSLNAPSLAPNKSQKDEKDNSKEEFHDMTSFNEAPISLLLTMCQSSLMVDNDEVSNTLLNTIKTLISGMSAREIVIPVKHEFVKRKKGEKESKPGAPNDASTNDIRISIRSGADASNDDAPRMSNFPTIPTYIDFSSVNMPRSVSGRRMRPFMDVQRNSGRDFMSMLFGNDEVGHILDTNQRKITKPFLDLPSYYILPHSYYYSASKKKFAALVTAYASHNARHSFRREICVSDLVPVVETANYPVKEDDVEVAISLLSQFVRHTEPDLRLETNEFWVEETCRLIVEEEMNRSSARVLRLCLEVEQLQAHEIEVNLKNLIDLVSEKTVTEQGVDDVCETFLSASKLLGFNVRQTCLDLLLDGVSALAKTVADQLEILVEELKIKQMANGETTKLKSESKSSAVTIAGGKGMLVDRFSESNDIVIINGPGIRNRTSDNSVPLDSLQKFFGKNCPQRCMLKLLKTALFLKSVMGSVGGFKMTVTKIPNATVNTLISKINGMWKIRRMYLKNLQKLKEELNLNSGGNDVPMETAQGKKPATEEAEPMDTDLSKPTETVVYHEEEAPACVLLKRELTCLHTLWKYLSDALGKLEQVGDLNAAGQLQPCIEMFFSVHAPNSDSRAADTAIQPWFGNTADSRQPNTVSEQIPDEFETQVETPIVPNAPDHVKDFISFAEQHRLVINQILRQSQKALNDGPFSALVNCTKVLDFDVKRRYFRSELEAFDRRRARPEDVQLRVNRAQVFENSFRELHRRGADAWKSRFSIVFEGEEGQDAGGLLREWYIIMSKEIFNPMYALFKISPGDRVTYMINSWSSVNSNHLSYFKFVGRFIAKAIYDNKLLDCYFTRSFYKHILGKVVAYTDMESEDPAFYQGLIFLKDHSVQDLGYELTFSTEVSEFGVNKTRDLKKDGRNTHVSDENKFEYIQLACQMKMTHSIRQQLNSFLEGFYEIIPRRLISIFNEQELELLISGMPNIDIDDLRLNTEYYKYQNNSIHIQWFWRSLKSFDSEEKAKFLQFVTGTSKVPLQGFAHLEGMTGPQKFQIHLDNRSTDRLPSAHTCFNQLNMPAYETYEKLRRMLLLAINECNEGFGFV